MIFAQFQFPTLVSVLLGQLAYIACVTSFLWCTPRLPKNLSFMDGLDGTSNYVIAVTMPPKKFVGTIRRFAKPPTDVTYFNIRF